jgi:hypothetical protein
VDLYKVVNNKLQAVDSQDFQLEREIQALVEENVSELFGLQFVSSEFAVSDFRLDSLCFDEENNSFVVIEYKRGSNYSVIDQGYSYLSVMLNNKADFILEYNERMSAHLKRSDVNWSGSRIIFISPAFNQYQKNSVNFKDVPFELWEIKRFEGSLLTLEQHKPSSKESIEKIGKGDSLINAISHEVKAYTEEGVLQKVDEKVVNVWSELKERLAVLAESEFVPQSNYVKFAKNNKGVCYFNFRKSSIKGEIIRGNISQDGNKSRNFFVIDDPKKICREYHFTYKSGIEGHRYLFDIDEKSDLDYLEMLIKQKYKAI